MANNKTFNRCAPEVSSDLMPGHAALFALPFAAFLAVASPLTGRQLGLQCAEFVQLFFRRFPRMHARCSTHVTHGP